MQIIKTKTQKLQDSVTNAPKVPGCYIYRNEKNKIIYVGKAKNLSNRVRSYFTGYNKLDSNKQLLVETIHSVEFITVDTELEALLLEANLIKKYRPKHNILLKDDKSYIYVRFERIRKSSQPIPTRDSVYQDFPRIEIIRKIKDDGAEYFGPYPKTLPAKRLLLQLRRVFPFRTSKHLVYQISEKPLKIFTEKTKPDLDHHIGLSGGADIGLQSKKDYLKNFRQIRRFFLGEKSIIIEELKKNMQQASKNKDFEKAIRFRDKIRDIEYIAAHHKITKDVDDVVIQSLKKSQREKALSELVNELEFPENKIPITNDFKIECYDISNIQGKFAVGSMVVMVNGEIQPNLYRRFRIKMKNEPNDFAMLQEVLTRRFKYLNVYNDEHDTEFFDYENVAVINSQLASRNSDLDESFSKLPNLIIIDGGKGQLASVYKILYKFNLHNIIPIVGLAKREEEIFKITDQFNDNFIAVEDSDRFQKIRLPKRSESLFLVQRIRDEAHRFAITYHRNLRSKELSNIRQ